jgi:hypothetical protein
VSVLDCARANPAHQEINMTLKAIRSFLLAVSALALSATFAAETTVTAHAAVFPSGPAHHGY